MQQQFSFWSFCIFFPSTLPSLVSRIISLVELHISYAAVRPSEQSDTASGGLAGAPPRVLAGAPPRVAETGQATGGGPVHWQISGHPTVPPICEQPNTT